MIIHYRIEEKLIDGIITTHILSHYKCDGIIIIDEKISSDAAMKNLLSSTVPVKTKVYCFGIEKGIKQMIKAESSALNYIVIMPNTNIAVDIVKCGYKFKLPITCGQQSMHDDSIYIMQGICLTDDDVDALDYIVSSGVNVILDPSGTNENVPWEKAKKTIESTKRKKANKSAGNKNTSLYKTLSILDCFLNDSSLSLSISEMQVKTQIPFSTCYRLVDFLEQNGYLTKNKKNKKYSLGWKLLLLATNSAASRKELFFQELAPPYLRILSNEYNETVSIFVRIGPKVKCICTSYSSHSLQVSPKLNKLTDIRDNSIGIILTAYLNANECKGLFGNNNEIIAVLKQARKNGYSTSIDKKSGGVSSISAPILGSDGEIYGAISMQGPTYRFYDDHFNEKIEQVKEIAQQLSKEIQQSLNIGI